MRGLKIQQTNLGTQEEKPGVFFGETSLSNPEPPPIGVDRSMNTFSTTNLSEYDNYFPEGNVFINEGLDESRAQRQSSGAKLGGGLVNTLSELTLGTLKNTSYLFDLPQYKNLLEGSENEFSNSFADVITKGMEAIHMDIYRTEASQGFHPESAGWWGEIMPSFASTASLAIPSILAVKGLGAAGKAMGGLKALESMNKVLGKSAWGVNELRTLEGVGSAVVSRHMESVMEGAQTYQETYQKILDQTGNEEQAKQLAGEAAVENYGLNWGGLLQDIPQYMIMFKGFGNAKVFRGMMEKQSSKTVTDVLKVAGLEGSEEMYQFMTNKESQYNVGRENGLTPSSTFEDRLLGYVKDGDFWTSAFAGFIGGGVFSGIALQQDRGRRLEENKKQVLYDTLKKQNEAVIGNSPSDFVKASDEGFMGTAINHFKGGTLNQFRKDLEVLRETPREILEKDPSLDIDNFTRTVDQRLKDLDYFEDIVAETNNSISIPQDLKSVNVALKLNQRLGERRMLKNNQVLSELTGEDNMSGLHSSLVELKKIKTFYDLMNFVKDSDNYKTDKGFKDQMKKIKTSLDEQYKSIIEDNDLFPEFNSKKDVDLSLNTSTSYALPVSSLISDQSDQRKTKDKLFKLQSKEGQEELLKELNEQKAKEVEKAAKVAKTVNEQKNENLSQRIEEENKKLEDVEKRREEALKQNFEFFNPQGNITQEKLGPEEQVKFEQDAANATEDINNKFDEEKAQIQLGIENLQQRLKDLAATPVETPGVSLSQLGAEPTEEVEVVEDSKERDDHYTRVFNPGKREELDQVINSTPDLVNKMSVRVTRNTRNPGQITEMSSSNTLNNVATEFDMEIIVDGKIIGYLPSFNRFATKDGQIINPLTINEEVFQRLFKPYEYHTLAALQREYKNAKAFNDYIKANIKGDELIISNEQLKSLASVDVTIGRNWDRVPKQEAVTPLTMFGDQLLVNGTPLIIDIQSSYNEQGVKVGFRTVDKFFGNRTNPANKEVEAEIEKVLKIVNEVVPHNLEEFEKKKWFSRYATLVQHAGGKIEIYGKKYHLIPIQPKALEDTDSLYRELMDKQATFKEMLSKGDPTTSDVIKKYNEDLENRVYIAWQTRSPGQRSIFTDLGFTLQGELRLIVGLRGMGSDTFYIGIDNPKNFQDIIDKINRKLVTPMEAKNFKHNIPQNYDLTNEQVKELVNKFTTLVTPNVRTGSILHVSFNKINPPAPKTPPAVKVVTQEPGIQKVSLGKNETSALDLLLGSSGPSANPLNRIQELQTKMKTGGGLNPAEKSEYDNLLSSINFDDPNNAFKISYSTPDELIDLEQAFDNLSKILPDFITWEEMKNVRDNIETGTYTWGEFVNGVIYLSKNSEAGTEYHEAFHPVFRILLPESQITSLLNQAREKVLQELASDGRTLNEVVKEYDRQLQARGYNLSDDKIKELIYEEWMADKFAEHMQNKKPLSFLEQFFDLIKRFFNWITGERFIDINSLFEKIERGGFKNAQVQKNRFDGRISPAFKLIPNGMIFVDGKPHITTDSSIKSEQKISTVTAEVFVYLSRNPKVFLSDAIAEVLNQKKSDYSNESSDFKDKELSPELETLRSQEFFTYSNPKSREIITKEVMKRFSTLSLLSDSIFPVDSNEDSEEQSDDKEQSTKNTWGKENEEHGGFSSLSKRLRQYIALTTYEYTDEFGIKRSTAVDSKKVYDGIIKATKNSLNTDEVFLSMDAFSEFSEQAGYFIAKFQKDVGASFNEDRTEFKIDENKKDLFNEVTKGFNKAQINYIFTRFDLDGKNYEAFSSNRKNVDIQQVEKWRENFVGVAGYLQENTSYKADLRKGLNKAVRLIKDQGKLNKNQLVSEATEIQEYFRKAGIDLSKGYIQYLLISGKKEENRTKPQQIVYDSFSNKVESDIEYILESIEAVSNLIEDGYNPFIKSYLADEKGEEKDLDKDAISRLKRLAKDNSIFDEQVGTSTFQNAEGKNRYEFQDFSFSTYRALQLRDKNFIKDREEANPYLQDNFISSSKDFNLYQKSLQIERIDGGRVTKTAFNKEEDERFEIHSLDKQDGVTYGGMKKRDLYLQMLALYTQQEKVKKGDKEVTLSPILSYIMETSNTADVVYLPIINGVDLKGTITPEYLEKMFNEVRREFRRIRRVEQERLNGETNIKDYNNGKLRGLDFWWTKRMLEEADPELYKGLKENSMPLEANKQRILNAADAYLNKIFNKYLDNLVKEDIIGINNSEGKDFYFNKILDQRFTVGEVKGLDRIFPHLSVDMGVSATLQRNLKQVFLNTYLNGIGWNQLLMGDPAIGVDEGNWVKRAKLINATGANFQSNDFLKLNYSIIPEPVIEIDGNRIDRADSQTWCHISFYRNAYTSLGRMDAEANRIYDVIEEGVRDLTWKEINHLMDKNVMPNPMKYVVMDGEVIIKTSGTLLHRFLTSNKMADGTWKAKTGKEELHNMLEEMERRKIHVTGPPSAFKKEIKNPSLASDDLHVNQIGTEYVKLQVENPSNTIYGKDGTQPLQIIDTEQVGEEYIKYGKEYQDLLDQRLKVDFSLVNSIIFKIKKEGVRPQLGEFQKLALKVLEKSGASDQLLELFSVDDNGNPKFNLNLPNALPKFVQLFNAHYNKVFSQVVPQYKTTIVSDFGLGVLENKKGEIVTRLEYNSTYKSRQSEVSSRRLAYNKKAVINGKEVFYSECIIPFHFSQQFGLNPGDEIPEEIAYNLGYRIPFSDKHSGYVLKIVDTLPASQGSSLVLPAELIRLVGHDFDLDSFYIHRPEFYIKPSAGQDRFMPYGNTEDSGWEQYLQYQIDRNKFLKDLIEGKYAAERVPADVLGTKALYSKGLKELGLPSNEQEYNKRVKKEGEQNLGVINNQLLKKKQFLISNPELQKIAQTPESEVPLIDAVNQLAKLLLNNPSATYQDLSFKYDPTSPDGLSTSFSNMKSGDAGIGPAINSELIFTFLEKYNIPLNSNNTAEIIINGKNHNTFSRENGLDRTMNILQSIAVAATNNGKTEVLAPANLTVENIGRISYLIMRGVPLLQSLYILNSPIISRFSQMTERKGLKTAQELKNSDGNVIVELLKTQSAKVKPYFTEEGSFEAEMERGITTEDLEDLLKNSNQEKPTAEEKKRREILEYKIIRMWKKVNTDSSSVFNIGQIIKLVKGTQTVDTEGDAIEDSLNELGYVLRKKNNKDEVELYRSKDFDSLELPFDIGKGLVEHKLTNRNLKIFGQIREEAKAVFLKRTDIFRRISDVTFGQLRYGLKNPRNIKNNIQKFLNAFLIIRGYKQMLINQGRITEAQGIDNTLLYKTSAEEKGVDDIIDMYFKLRTEDPINFNSNPLFRAGILTIERVGNLNKIQMNTRSQGNKEFQNRLSDGFLQLLTSPNYKAKEFGKKLFNYLLAKDAMLFMNNSFVSVISPVLFKEVSLSIDDIQKLMEKGYGKDLDEKYKKLFGSSQKELFDEFTEMYLSHKPNTYQLPVIGEGTLKNKEGSKLIDFTKEGFTVDLFGGTKKEDFYGVRLEGITSENATDILEQLDKKTGAKGQLKANFKALSSIPWFLPTIKVESEDGKRDFTEIVFRKFVKIRGEDKLERLYKLESIDTMKTNEKGKTERVTEPVEIDSDRTTAIGVGATYVEISPIGDQNGYTLPYGRTLEENKKEADAAFKKPEAKPLPPSVPDEQLMKDPEYIKSLEKFQPAVKDISNVKPQMGTAFSLLGGQSDEIISEQQAKDAKGGNETSAFDAFNGTNNNISGEINDVEDNNECPPGK